MLHLKMIEDEGGPAAHTGSAVHFAAKQFHGGSDVETALVEMRKNLAAYPLADLHDAELSFRPYAADPRNQNAKIVLCEKTVTFELDKKSKIWVQMTVDQVRESNGRLEVFDIKTGTPEGWLMLYEHAIQIAAYCIGAERHLQRPVHPGAIIRTRGYRKKEKLPPDPEGVFFEFSWGRETCNILMDAVRQKVAQVRKGIYSPSPGDHCRFCPAAGPEQCVPKYLGAGK